MLRKRWVKRIGKSGESPKRFVFAIDSGGGFFFFRVLIMGWQFYVRTEYDGFEAPK